MIQTDCNDGKMTSSALIQIDLRNVLRDKLGSRARYIPGFAVNAMSRMICQEQLNEMLRVNYPNRGKEFCRGVMEHLDISLRVANPEKMPAYDNRRLLIVSNHPLGGLDGIALIRLLGERYGDDIRFVVNDLLMAVEPLSDVFLPVNKHGGQDRSAISAINDAMASDAPVMVFPAGLVSRRGSDGYIRDLEWHKMFVLKARQYKRDVLPLYFSGENTSFFYRLARWRERLGIKFNIEMLRLPAEVFRSRGKTFTVAFGDIIPYTTFRGGIEATAEAARVRDIVYSLKDKVGH